MVQLVSARCVSASRRE
ncbi:MAG: hypothetical protein QM707_02510 [Arenimonas sp.]